MIDWKKSTNYCWVAEVYSPSLPVMLKIDLLYQPEEFARGEYVLVFGKCGALPAEEFDKFLPATRYYHNFESAKSEAETLVSKFLHKAHVQAELSSSRSVPPSHEGSAVPPEPVRSRLRAEGSEA